MNQKEEWAHPFSGEPKETTAGATEQLETHTKSEYVQDAAVTSMTVPLILDRIRLHKPDAMDGKGRPMGKAPLLSGWRRLPALTEGEVTAHLAKGMNVGARLRDDQLVIDADPRHYEDGVNSLDRLIADFCLPHGPTVETGGGGFHIYLRKPAGVRVRDTLDGYPGVEFKTVGRQVVIPPSVHPNGHGYRWDALFGSDMTVPDVPDALLDRLLRPPRPSVTSGDDWTSEKLRGVLEGLDARDFDSNDTWLEMAMSCHQTTAGEGIDVFLDWCATDPKYADRLPEARARWDSFSAEKDGPKRTRLTIYKALHAAGRGDLVEWAERSDPVEDFASTSGDYLVDGPVQVRRPAFITKGGSYRNVLRAIEAGNLGVGFDVIAQRPWLRAERLPWVADVGRELNDDLIRIVREWVMEQYRFEPAKDNVSEVLLAMATKNPFNPIVDYLDALEWDGTARVDALFPRYFGAADGAYERAVGRKLLVAAVRRARRPGAKFDTVPIIEGIQGTGKTSALKILGGGWHSDAELGRVDGKDAPAVLQGVWIMELGELTAMKKGEVEQLKAFVSRCEDRYRAPYDRHPKTHPRRCVFVGTTNSDEYLRDQTGNRRYLPVVTTTIDLDGLRRGRDQLWAEASVIEATGEGLTLPPDLWSVAAQRQGDRLVGDPWLDPLRAYVAGKQRVSSRELFESVLEIPYNRQSQLEAKRLSGVMSQLGFQHRKSLRFGQQVLTGYVIRDDPTNGGAA